MASYQVHKKVWDISGPTMRDEQKLGKISEVELFGDTVD